MSKLTCLFLEHHPHPACHALDLSTTPTWPRQQVELGDELALRYNDKSGHPKYDIVWRCMAAAGSCFFFNGDHWRSPKTSKIIPLLKRFFLSEESPVNVFFLHLKGIIFYKMSGVGVGVWSIVISMLNMYTKNDTEFIIPQMSRETTKFKKTCVFPAWVCSENHWCDGPSHIPWLSQKKGKSGWWFQKCCIFTPTWGNDPIWRAYFSNGLGSTTN